MDKEKKKTLTISSDLKKKIDTSSISTSGKKSFSVEKKKNFRSNKLWNNCTKKKQNNFMSIRFRASAFKSFR